jgi:polyisoprenoid-binding protein YceI
MRMRLVVIIGVFVAMRAMAADQSSAPPPSSSPIGPSTTMSPAPATQRRVYVLDQKKSSFVVQVFRAGAASALAHDHVVHATAMFGTIEVEGDDPSSAQIDITVPTKSLVNDDPVMRKRFGLEGEIAEKDRAAILANLRHPDQLDVELHPVITFRSTSVQPVSGSSMTLHGILTIRGRARPITLPIDVEKKGDAIDGKGTLRFKTSDFGITPYAAFFGAVRNQDAVVLHLRLVAHVPSTDAPAASSSRVAH